MITTLRITGMTCNSCARHVDEALRGVAGVTAVDVDLPGGRASVVHADSAPVAVLVEAVAGAGYEATP